MNMPTRLAVASGIVVLVAGVVIGTLLWPRSAPTAGQAASQAPSPAASQSATGLSTPLSDPDAPEGTSAPSSPTPELPASTTTPEATQPPAAPSRTPVDVVVTIGEWAPSTQTVDVAGYAAVVQEGATCTLTLTRGDAVVTTQTHASLDATTTSCGVLSIPGSKLTSGNWTAVLSYDSHSSTGSSTPVPIEVNR